MADPDRFLSHVSPVLNRFTPHRTFQAALDLTVAALALITAFHLTGASIEIRHFAWVLPVVLLVRMTCRVAFGLDVHVWRYTGLRELLDVIGAVSVGSAILFALGRWSGVELPIGAFAMEWSGNLLGLLALRGMRRVLAERHLTFPRHAKTRVLLVGAGKVGNLIAREMRLHNPEIALVGFVDDAHHKLNSRIQGRKVLGGTSDLPRLVSRHHVQEITLCLPSASRAELRRILDICQRTPCKVKVLPGLQAMISGQFSVSRLREVQIEDLLGRDPVPFDRDLAGAYLQNKVVLVTGAGGSIGSELCRQIARLKPQRLLLLGRGEFSIYKLEMELREAFPELTVLPLIADVRDATRLNQVFAEHLPDVVFHAAAHKHVPLMEANPSEAIVNNVLGTRVMAEMADRFDAEAFVLISTDKAVNPTSVMGASKRVAEMVVTDMASRSKTRFMAVRFGNVLGSRGSVVPLFRHQIERGGPVTLTHPDMIRYFMTIPEACQLVVEAGAIGRGGEVFVLDMGEPVKILDLAHQMIRLSGLEPDVDIAVTFTGLRPGEKLYEELLTAEEGASSTKHKKIFVAKPEPLAHERLERGLAALHMAAQSGDAQTIRRTLKNLVTAYVGEGAPVAASPQSSGLRRAEG